MSDPVEAITPEEFIAQMNPGMASDVEKRDLYITLATSMTSVGYFGKMTNYAIALRAMHTYAIDQTRPKGEAGLITSLSEGTASIRYWNKVERGRYSDLQMTHWGQRLLALIKSRGGTVSVAADPTNLLSSFGGE